GQQFDSAFAFVDRFLFLAQGGKDQSQLSVSSRLLRGFTHKLLRNSTRLLEGAPRLFFITLIPIELTLQKSLRAPGSCAVRQCSPAKLLHPLKSLRKFPL